MNLKFKYDPIDEQDRIDQMMSAIDLFGRDVVLSVRGKAIMNNTLESVEFEMTVMGGKFKAVFEFDGREP